MTKKDKPKLKLIDFKVAQEEIEKLPDNIMESIEALYKKAQNGNLKELVLYAEWDPDEGDESDGPTGAMSIWNKDNNIKAIIGTLVMLKGIALEALMASCYLTTEEEE